MAKTTIVTLTDDLDGGEADETITFSLDGRAYEIDLNKKNASTFRKAMARYVEHGRSAGRQGRGKRGTSGGAAPTLFSQLSEDEKARFRKWAKMPNARRIADQRVVDWTTAGKP